MPSGPGGGSGSQPELRRSASTAYERVAASSLFRSDTARQRKIPALVKLGLVKRLGKAVSRFFVYENVAANKVKSPYFKNMIQEAQEVGT